VVVQQNITVIPPAVITPYDQQVI
jgi:hypothetical protein